MTNGQRIPSNACFWATTDQTNREEYIFCKAATDSHTTNTVHMNCSWIKCLAKAVKSK